MAAEVLSAVRENLRSRTGRWAEEQEETLREKGGIGLAVADLTRMLPMAWEKFPGGPMASTDAPNDYTPILQPLKDDLVGPVANLLWVLLGGVSVVLLISCANVANLFLVRAEANETEMAARPEPVRWHEIVGFYGVIAYAVARRSCEIGMRIALGAQKETVMKMVLRQGFFLAIIGTGVGVVIALGLTHLMKSLLYEVSPLELPTYIVVIVGLLTVAMLASYLPARRAAGVEPMEALRIE